MPSQHANGRVDMKIQKAAEKIQQKTQKFAERAEREAQKLARMQVCVGFFPLSSSFFLFERKAILY